MDKIVNDFSLYKPKAVFISHVSNVTGYQVPYEEIFDASLESVVDYTNLANVINTCLSKK